MKKSFKIFTAIAAFATAASVIVLGSVVASDPENGFLRRAFAAHEPISEGSIVFDGTPTSSGTTNTTSGKTQYGSVILCKVFDNDITQSEGKIGAATSSSTLRFYEADGVTEYVFEDIAKLKISFSSAYNSFEQYGFYDDGEAFHFTSSGVNKSKTITYTSYGNVSRLWLQFTHSGTVLINSVELVYNCVSKTQTDIEISTLPTKTEYAAGESFDASGMVVKSVYNNSSKIATDNYSVSPSGALSVDDTYVTISSNGFSKTVQISVSEQTSGLNGTFTNGSDASMVIHGTSGTYSFYDGADTYNVSFTLAISGTKITFTKESGDDDSNFGAKRLFNGSNTNNTGIYVSDSSFTVKMYSTFGSQTKTFTKQ